MNEPPSKADRQSKALAGTPVPTDPSVPAVVLKADPPDSTASSSGPMDPGSQPSSTHRPSPADPQMKLVGMGIELAGMTLAGVLLGYGIDRLLANDRNLGVAFGALVGFSGGMFRFIQRAQQAQRDAESSRKANRTPTD